jgi:hypothetical protein
MAFKMDALRFAKTCGQPGARSPPVNVNQWVSNPR